VQVHVRLVSDPDLVGGAETDEYPVNLPDEPVLGALVNRAGKVLLERGAPGVWRRKSKAVDPEPVEMLVCRLVKVGDPDIEVDELHRADFQAVGSHGRAV
jgi:hypothetical protein